MNVELWWAGKRNSPDHSHGKGTVACCGTQRGDADAAAVARRDSSVAHSAYPGLFTSPSAPSATGFGGRPGAVSRLRVVYGRWRGFSGTSWRLVCRLPAAMLTAINTAVREMLAQLSSAGLPQFGLLGWTRFHVGHGRPQSRLASTTLPSHAFHAAPHEHRLVAGAASPRKPYL